MLYKRKLAKPAKSFFLFGPRGTGKSTWLRQNFPCAQVTNLQGLARDSGINRNSVRGFFSILEDTLMGKWLPAYRRRAKVKEVSHPKFYWFDAGVLRAAAGGILQPLPSDWRGKALETWLFHELSAHLHYSNAGGMLSYWRTPSGSEVDFVWQKGTRTVAIEAKASRSYT